MQFQLRTLLGLFCLAAVLMGLVPWITYEVIETAFSIIGWLAYLALAGSVVYMLLDDEGKYDALVWTACLLVAFTLSLSLLLVEIH